MLMADTMAIFFIVLGLMLAFPGLWLLCRGLWPNAVAHAAARCSKGLIKSFLAGLPITFIVSISSIALSKGFGALGQIAAIALICLYLLHAHVGVSGLATCIGDRLKSSTDAGRQWRATLRGGIALEMSYLLPILGWFIILPASIIIGSGAAALSSLSFKKAASPILVEDEVSAIGVGANS